jgi:hypothetical protein
MRQWWGVLIAIAFLAGGCGDGAPDPTEKDSTLWRIDIDVDVNRDGRITEADQEDLEDKEVVYLAPTGAIVLANTDFDGKIANHKRDCDDEEVNGQEDLKDDIGKFIVRTLRASDQDVPDALTVTLELVNPPGDDAISAKDKVRVFAEYGNSAQSVLGPQTASIVFRKNPGADERDIGELIGSKDKEFGIEGLEYGAQVILRMTATLGAEVVGIDEARILVAPYIFVSNGGGLNHAFIAGGGRAQGLADEFKKLVGIGITTVINADDYPNSDKKPDPWVQDCMEFGYSRFPAANTMGYHEMLVVLDLARGFGVGALPAQLSEPPYNLNYGYIKPVAGPLDAEGSTGGNIEVSLPTSAWPAGRIVVGSGLNQDIKKFMLRQKVQVHPTEGVIEKDTSWLAVGHIDEVVSFCQVGGADRILIAAPHEAVQLWTQAGGIWAVRANATVKGFLEASGLPTTRIPADVLSMTVKQYNDKLWSDHIKNVRQTLPAQVGMDPGAMILLPVVFLPNSAAGGKAATLRFPDRVNLFVRGSGSFVVGDVGPDIQPTPDPLKAEVQQRLGNIPERSFLDSSVFHENHGDIHCASHSARSGPSKKEWAP